MKRISYVTRAMKGLDSDVMSASFQLDVPLAKLQADPRAVFESIMDQNILPGVGNIIKCEGLLEAGLHPNSTTCHIPEEMLKDLLLKLKDFAWRWYACTKGGSGDIHKKVYGRDYCSVCQSVVTLVRSGAMRRISYYCTHCQYLFDRPGMCLPKATLTPSTCSNTSTSNSISAGISSSGSKSNIHTHGSFSGSSTNVCTNTTPGMFLVNRMCP